MKKILLLLFFAVSSVLNAQDNWDTLITNGVGPNQTRFNLVKVFKNKIYVAGSDSLGLTINAYSSSTGNYGSFANEAGLSSALQGGNEGAITAATNDNNFLFYGSGVQYNGVNNFLPQVYKFDGTTYSSFGTIPHDVTGPNRMVPANKPFIGALALYSPTGSNDSIYAIVNPDSAYLGVTVWKSPVSSPNWVNVTKFDSASGVTIVNDAIVWHKRLYIAVSGRDSGGVRLSYILSTANGSSWDTVAKTSTLFTSVGVLYYNYTGCNFNQFEIHNDSLFTTFTYGYSGYPIWYTTDSLSSNPSWHNLPYINGSCWGEISDLQSAFGKLWFGVNISPCRTSGYRPSKKLNQINQTADYGFNANGSTNVFCYHNGQYLSSSGGTNIGDWYANWHDKLAFFNNALYTAGAMDAPQTYAKYGNLWRVLPPTASFTDSSSMGLNFCTSNAAYLKCTSTHAINAMWTINDTVYSHTPDTTWFPSRPGTYTVTLTAYNGDPYYTNFLDSTTSTITVLQTPIIDSTVAKYLTLCQGQPDTIRMYTHLGTSPFTYTYLNTINNEFFNNVGNPGIVNANTAPTAYFKGIIKDANGCINSNGFVVLSVNNGDSLSGTIVDTLLNSVTVGKVYLFQKKANHVGVADSSGIFDLSTTGNGKFYFPSLYYGDYLLKAVADTGNLLYKTSVGTYYSNKLHAYQWDSALVIQQHTCVGGNNSGKDIKIIQIPNIPGGPGTITGNITESNSFGTRYSGPNSTFGAPLKGVDIKLGKNPGGSPAARTTTDNSGNYSFTNVPIGQYKIYVDIPNYGMDSVRLVDLNVTATSVHNDYYVDSAMVRVVPIDSVTKAICAGDSIMLGGSYQLGAGIYTDVVQTLWSYDSVVVTTLSIKPLPTLTVTSSSDSVCIGNSVVLTATGNGTSYLWSSNAGSATTSTVSVSPTVNTVYTVTTTGSNGCPVKHTISIISKACIGIQNVSQQGLSVYPNPASNKLFIESAKGSTIKLVSVLGQTVLEQSISIGKNEININSLPMGAYELIINAQGQLTNQKIIISR